MSDALKRKVEAAEERIRKEWPCVSFEDSLRAPNLTPEPPGAKKKRAHEKIAPYRNDFWAHLNGAIEKKKSQKPRKKKKPDLVPGQTFLNFAPRPPPPPGPPPEDSPPPPEVIDVDAVDADLTQD